MIDEQFTLHEWVSYLDMEPLPILRRTAMELARLHEKEDELNGRDLAAVILRDPVMTVKVLRYLQAHRGKSQVTDITTIGRAVIMIGTTPFFRQFSNQPIIEDKLADFPEALAGMMRVISRAHHAGLYAVDWSEYRHDIETDEVVIAAVLHDLAEILLWCFAPTPMIRIRDMMLKDSTLRSATAQQMTLGFRLIDLQLALASKWHMPKLLLSLMDESVQEKTPRSKTVALAVALARHSANGWNDAALPDDFEGIHDLLRLSPEDTWERVLKVTLRATDDWDWYKVPPAAAWLPMQTV